MTTGERIRMVRKERNLTQGEFGKRISLVASAICQLENNSSVLTERVERDICREFGINQEWLESGSGDMYTKDGEKEVLTLEFANIISKYPSLYETAKIVSKHMTKQDWKRASELLDEMGG